VAAWVRRNGRHVVSVRLAGAGEIFSALRTRRMVDALTRQPSLSSSPWIRWYPQGDANLTEAAGGQQARYLCSARARKRRWPDPRVCQAT